MDGGGFTNVIPVTSLKKTYVVANDSRVQAGEFNSKTENSDPVFDWYSKTGFHFIKLGVDDNLVPC